MRYHIYAPEQTPSLFELFFTYYSMKHEYATLIHAEKGSLTLCIMERKAI